MGERRPVSLSMAFLSVLFCLVLEVDVDMISIV